MATDPGPPLAVVVAGAGRARYVAWPPEKKVIDIGSFYADSSRFRTAAAEVKAS